MGNIGAIGSGDISKLKNVPKNIGHAQVSMPSPNSGGISGLQMPQKMAKPSALGGSLDLMG